MPGTGTAPLPQTADVTNPRVPRGLADFKYTYSPSDSFLKESVFNTYYQFIGRRAKIDSFPEVSPIVEITPSANHYTIGANWQNTMQFGDNTLVAGIDSWERKISSSRDRLFRNGTTLRDTPLPDAAYLSTGLFAEDTWKASERLKLTAGLRGDLIYVHKDATPVWDPHTDNQTSWNANLGGAYRLIDKLSLKLQLARGYRAATLEERYAYLNLSPTLTKYGDPNLDPEHDLYGELGLQWAGEKLGASVSAYLNKLKDLIADKRVDENTIISENINEAEIHGVEGEIQYYLTKNLKIYTAAASAIGSDTKNHENLPDIAPFNGYSGVRFDEGDEGFSAFIETRYSSRATRTPVNTSPVDGWGTLDLGLGYSFKAGTTSNRVFAGLNNLFNANYQEYLTHVRGLEFNEPGRSVSVSYEVKF